MTMLGTDHAFIARVRNAGGGAKTRGHALQDAVQCVGTRIGSHEAETVAQALRHRYDGIVEVTQQIVVAEWRDDDIMSSLRIHMRKELVLTADARFSALVDEPVEWRYDVPQNEFPYQPADDDRGRTPLTSEQVAALPDDYAVLLKLVGHVQKLDS